MKANTPQQVGTLLILAGVLGGCAAIERQQAGDTEKLLVAAGFRMLPADTAERRGELAGMAPFELVVQHRDARTVYTYADPLSCRCLYVGGPAEYAKYREFEVSEDIARDMSTASMNSASTNFPIWASWDPQWAPSEGPLEGGDF
jgi:hypothetical protein